MAVDVEQDTTIKTCSCGRSYTKQSWAQLEYAGLQDDYKGGWLELRNCQCRNTMAIEVTPAQAEALRVNPPRWRVLFR